MKRLIRFIARALGMLGVFWLLAVSCASPQGAGLTVRVTIMASEHGPAAGARGVVWNPAPPTTELAVLVDGDGPGDEGFSSAQTTDGTLELDLVAGNWVFEARAVDADGLVILSGSEAARVDTVDGSAVTIVLTPPEGHGTIDVRYALPAGAPDGAVWRCELSDASGAAIRSWDDAAGVAGRVLDDVPTGYYELSARLLDGDMALAGSTGLVRVLRGMSTPVSVSAAIPAAEMGIGASLEAREPLAVSASMLSRAAVRGFPLRVGASGPVSATYRWSVAGSVVAEGKVADISTKGFPAGGTLDLGVFSGSTAGAASLAFMIEDRAVKAGWCHYATIDAVTDPGSQVLARPAMLSASADGSVLCVGSDGSSSRVEAWRARAPSGELAPVSSAAVRVGGTARKATMVTTSPSGDWVAAANSESGWIWMAPIGDEGALGTPFEFTGGSVGVEGMGYVRGLCFSPDSTRLYALSNSDRSVYAFSRIGGAWSAASRAGLDELPCGALSVLKGMALSPDGTKLAIAAAGSDAVVLLDAAPDSLAWRGQARLSDGYAGLDYPQALAFAPDGSKLAVACRDSAALVLLDSAPPAPATETIYGAAEGLSGIPQALVFSSDGAAVGVTAADGMYVVRLPYGAEPATVARFDTEDAPALGAPLGIAAGPGSFLVACPSSGAIAIIGEPYEK